MTPSLSMYYTRTNTGKKMDLKLLKMFCKGSKQHHVIFHELYLVSSLLCIALNVRFEIPYKVLYFETPFLMIFKYYAWASYGCTWQWKPCKPTWTGGQFKLYIVRNLPKFASVPELKQFLLEIYSVEQSPATDHSFTVGYTSDRRTKCDIKTDKQCMWTAFKMQISK